MKIFFCINTMGHGGAERVVSILANELSKDNEVTIFTLGSNESYYEIKKTVACRSLSKRKNKHWGGKVLKICRSIRNLRKEMKSGQYDLGISFLPEASFVMLLSKLNCKRIISVRNDPNREYNNVIYRFLMKNLYRKADGLVVQTPDVESFFRKEIGLDSRIILNPVDSSVVKYRDYDGGERKKEIASVGRLCPQKNFPLLINAFALVCDEIPGYKLKIYGDGPERFNIERIISYYGISDRVELCGARKDLFKHLSRSTLFILPSDYEGMPNALIEAMALGIPVISTDCPCGGPRYLIKNMKNGILTPVGDVERLGENIVFLIKNKRISEGVGREAKKIIDRVNKEKIVTEWKDYIAKVTNSLK